MQRQIEIAERGSLLALFPMEQRDRLLQIVLKGEETPERYLLYGLDVLFKCKIQVKTNLAFKNSPNQFVRRNISMLYRPLAKKVLGAQGNIEWLLPVWSEIRRSPLIYAFSERSIYPILVFRSIGLLPRVAMVVISIGIAEKLQALAMRRKVREQKWLLREMKYVSQIITFSSIEEDILKRQFGLANVSFVPLGVDVTSFRPRSNTFPVDVLGVGADKNRDFEIFIQVAHRLPAVNFKLITNNYHAAKLTKTGLPANVSMRVNVPLKEIANEYAGSKIVFLPIRENTYSGATTCLLQAMSSARPVVTNRVGATKRGYQFVHNHNLVFVKTGDAKAAAKQIEKLLEEGARRRYIGRNARELVEKNFTLDAMIQSILTKVGKEYSRVYGVKLPGF